jgi:DNA-directed RNA polymerase specialized sigma24 family protein
VPRSHVGTISPQVQALLEAKSVSPSPDELLLERFVSRRDDVAFETLVRRHGPMVLAVCRGVLNDREAAEDAAQATFLVLVRKAGSVRAGSSLGSWLYRVAYNMATQINVDASRREGLRRRPTRPDGAADGKTT